MDFAFRLARGVSGRSLRLAIALAAAACAGDPELRWGSAIGGGSADASLGPGPSSGSGGTGVVIVTDGSLPSSDAPVNCELDARCVYALPDAGPYCGDGVVNQPSEQCDDGNVLPGDGCTGVCAKEPNFDCPPPGGRCGSTIRCGDGIRTPGEACDDGNTSGGDGCSASCAATESGWHCPTPGAPCVKLVNCGDGRVQTGEGCDDGNVNGGDGCDSGCRVESGYRCVKPGSPCNRVPVCGDGKVEGAELCDDANVAAGDGCSSACRIEASYYSCPPLGGPCIKTVRCGDGKVEDTEQCDDGNSKHFDGCSATCFTDSGWKCPVPGRKCVPYCGDGRKLGIEECDDGNPTSGDGCSSTCRLEPGHVCPTVAAPCRPTICGDGIAEGSELCDQGPSNGIFTGDPNSPGCSSTCTPEPRCREPDGTTHACTSRCGDGMLVGSEVCDDGNLSNGDGCSSLCQTEPGFTCTTVTSEDTKPCSSGTGQCLTLPIVYRDFHGLEMKDGTASPDFFYIDPLRPMVTTLEGSVQMPGCVQDQLCPGLVQPMLDAQGKPLRASSGAACLTCSAGSGPSPYLIHSDASFSYWFRGRIGANRATSGTLELEPIAGGQYRFARVRPGGLFPLDALTWGGEPTICQVWPYWTQDPASCGTTHNYHFTTEVRYLFPYRGGETLAFVGDDDVWVFVNGRLVVDLGGTHQQLSGSITIDASNQATFGMSPNNLYEIVVFQAERNPIDSNYQLTLSGFGRVQSRCAPTCGDGVATVFEECDDGPANNDTAYEGCTTQCKFGPRCGDRVVQVSQGEECDDGANATIVYGATGCAPGCKLPPRCGDTKLDLGEECDNGPANRDPGYGACTTKCLLGPRCGDGVVDGAFGEECDDGLNVGGYGQCDVGCKWGPRCGDGLVQQGESCDDGADNGLPGKCATGCAVSGRCGDGIVQPGEQCDDGINDNSYGGCAADCRYGPRCGDGVVQSQAGEQCDLGPANQDGLYGGCSTKCRYGPHCGDGIVQMGAEQCDDGNNSNGDGCSAACRTEIVIR